MPTLPILIFPSEPYDGPVVDSCFQAEFEEARKQGFETCLYSMEEKRLWSGGKTGSAIYRGWMFSVEEYSDFSALLHNRELELLTDPLRYQHFHHLPEWYESVAQFTPHSLWFEGPQFSQEEVVKTFGCGSLVLKDFVKSAKHYWKTACYIPDLEDGRAVAEVVRNFLEIRGEDLTGGLVFRRFLNLRSLGPHPKSGMPLTLEQRLFFARGKLLACFPYWETEYPEQELPIDTFESWAASQGEGFFVLDVACDESGKWWIIEFGDAQVSGLPTEHCLEPFYASLKSVFDG